MNVSFRQKILLAAVPALIVVLLLVGVLVRTTLRDSRVAQSDLRAANTARAAMLLLNEVHLEMRGEIEGSKVVANRLDFPNQVRKTDEAADRLRLLLGPDSATAEIEDFDRTIAEHLAAVRAALATSNVTDSDRLAAYDALSNDLSTLTVVLVGSARSTRLNARSNEVIALLGFQDSYNRQLVEVQRQLSAESVGLDAAAAYRESAAAADRSLARLIAISRPRTVSILTELQNQELAAVDSAGDTYLSDLSDSSDLSDAARVSRVDPMSWLRAGDTAVGAVHRLEVGLFDEFLLLADEIETSARRRAVAYLGLGFAAFASAAVAAYLVGANLGRRLSTVRNAAHSIATVQLPMMLETESGSSIQAISEAMPQIPVTGGDEIGQLAEHFNRVFRLAVETSIEQSLRHAAAAHSQRQGAALTNLLVSLGHRNQALIDRQLEVIDQLEAEQSDPRALAGLFQLDHMVTRQRRSAESLLVLAGSRRTRAWTDSLPISQVLRGAVSEVAMMSRVVLEILPGDDLVLLGSHAVDLSHLLAELIENATLYSSPTTSVTVRTHRSDDCYRVFIADAGVGMTGEQLAAAHRSMSSDFEVDQVNVGQVGFQVVGRLAALIGVGVRVYNDPDGGIVAVVEMPLSLFEHVVDGTEPRRRGRTEPVNLDRPVDRVDALVPSDWDEIDSDWDEIDVGLGTDDLLADPTWLGPHSPHSPADITLPGLVVGRVAEQSPEQRWQPPLPRRQPVRSGPKRSDDVAEIPEMPCDRPRLPTTRIAPADGRAASDRRRSLAGFTQAVARGRDGVDLQDEL